jgi:hypothetical protein
MGIAIHTIARDLPDGHMMWVQIAIVVGLLGVIAVAALRRRRVPPDVYADIDTGSVSENWLAEERGRKD